MTIRFSTYNISNGSNEGLESALQVISQANMDVGIFQETKVTDGIYTCGSDGYSIDSTDIPSRPFGGVEVFYQPAPYFAVEAVRQFGPNVVGFQLTAVGGSGTLWYVTLPTTTH